MSYVRHQSPSYVCSTTYWCRVTFTTTPLVFCHYTDLDNTITLSYSYCIINYLHYSKVLCVISLSCSLTYLFSQLLPLVLSVPPVVSMSVSELILTTGHVWWTMGSHSVWCVSISPMVNLTPMDHFLSMMLGLVACPMLMDSKYFILYFFIIYYFISVFSSSPFTNHIPLPPSKACQLLTIYLLMNNNTFLLVLNKLIVLVI